jgi:hypothetical protein
MRMGSGLAILTMICDMAAFRCEAWRPMPETSAA